LLFIGFDEEYFFGIDVTNAFVGTAVGFDDDADDSNLDDFDDCDDDGNDFDDGAFVAVGRFN
jgi:hypothetical protein